MSLINRSFNGKLNLDVSPFRVPPNDFIEALNITRDAEGGGQDHIVSNLIGNQRVLYSLPNGTNKRIGSHADPLRNRIYYWVWNSYGNNLWLYYDKTNDTIIKLIEDLTDTNNIPVLDFDPSFRINHSDIVYRDEGDLVSWTDGHTTPKEANIDFILGGVYGVIQSNFIEAAKMPPLTPPLCQYQNDATRVGNSLRRKLFQFCSAYRYDTLAISTPSTFSKIPLPIGVFGSDNDIDSSNNNNISIIVETGDKNVTDIEIYMRSNIGDAWGDFVTIIVLNKEQLNIPDNSTYQYYFYNDNIYPTPTQNFQYVTGVQVVPLFDWIPQLANTQCQPNGNVKAFGAITENYDNYPISELDVSLTAENQTNIPPDTDPSQLSYVEPSPDIFDFTVTGTLVEGTNFKVYIFFNGTPPTQTHGVFLVAQYTSIGGDTNNDVAFELYSQFNSYPSTPIIIGSYFGNGWQSNIGTAGSYVFRIDVTQGVVDPSAISSQKTWLWDCPYVLGIVYEDEQGRAMPGVTTYANPAGGDNDFVVNTPSFSLDSATPQTPVLSFEINHLPPDGAVKYNLVRRRLAFNNPLMYVTCDFQEDDDYFYFCLFNIDKFKADNSQFIYGSAGVTDESRIKIIAGVTTGVYDGTLFTEDYQVVGTVTRTLNAGTSPDDDVPFIKVVKPDTPPTYQRNMLVMVYTPMPNPTNNADSVYWEWGETYGIYELNGVNYHEGLDQDQTASQPATFTFIEGDVYYRQRPMYMGITGAPPYTPTPLDIMDGNYSDYFDSLVNDNGRGQAIATNARRQFNPVLIRFSEAYQSGTNINGLNRFYFENFVEEDRSWGNIEKLFIDRRYLYVFQEFNVGVVPILTQIVRDVAGNPLEANSDILLNKITYPYDKQYGIGNVPESFAYGKGAMYGIDNNKGIVWRLSQNGMEAISVIFECNAFFVAQLVAYKTDLNNRNAPPDLIYVGNPTCYGVFDSYTNKYIISLEEINRYNVQHSLIFHQDPTTISFLETRGESEGFESKYSYHSEGMECLNNLTVSFKNGELWKHDSTTYCSFYGIQYTAYITGVFNDNILQKKSWQALTLMSEVKWSCPVMYTNVNSYGTTKQESELIEEDFEFFEQYPSAGLLRDKNSVDGLLNGSYLKGSYLVVRFQKNDASNLVILVGAALVIRDSALTGN